jgi:hypothetical protein
MPKSQTAHQRQSSQDYGESDTQTRPNSDTLTQKQLRFIGKLATEMGMSRVELVEHAGGEPEKLTKNQATELINSLLDMKDNPTVNEIKKEFSS